MELNYDDVKLLLPILSMELSSYENDLTKIDASVRPKAYLTMSDKIIALREIICRLQIAKEFVMNAALFEGTY